MDYLDLQNILKVIMHNSFTINCSAHIQVFIFINSIYLTKMAKRNLLFVHIVPKYVVMFCSDISHRKIAPKISKVSLHSEELRRMNFLNNFFRLL